MSGKPYNTRYNLQSKSFNGSDRCQRVTLNRDGSRCRAGVAIFQGMGTPTFAKIEGKQTSYEIEEILIRM